eukprot:TRINITY_DN6470_c0_g2_i1.p1 TRINITY_DN6470_c0_g2~~TRINITY_DN6470_c0_g2_i1.p1  ORF type:complete len:1069 (+),score=295.47 TRINITY_DN6470_c0_g2_i1:119-3325(+)
MSFSSSGGRSGRSGGGRRPQRGSQGPNGRGQQQQQQQGAVQPSAAGAAPLPATARPRRASSHSTIDTGLQAQAGELQAYDGHVASWQQSHAGARSRTALSPPHPHLGVHTPPAQPAPGPDPAAVLLCVPLDVVGRQLGGLYLRLPAGRHGSANGASVWRRKDGAYYLYRAHDGRWCVRSTANFEDGGGYIKSQELHAPQPHLVLRWTAYMENSYSVHTGISCSADTNADDLEWSTEEGMLPSPTAPLRAQPERRVAGGRRSRPRLQVGHGCSSSASLPDELHTPGVMTPGRGAARGAPADPAAASASASAERAPGGAAPPQLAQAVRAACSLLGLQCGAGDNFGQPLAALAELSAARLALSESRERSALSAAWQTLLTAPPCSSPDLVLLEERVARARRDGERHEAAARRARQGLEEAQGQLAAARRRISELEVAVHCSVVQREAEQRERVEQEAGYTMQLLSAQHELAELQLQLGGRTAARPLPATAGEAAEGPPCGPASDADVDTPAAAGSMSPVGGATAAGLRGRASPSPRAPPPEHGGAAVLGELQARLAEAERHSERLLGELAAEREGSLRRAEEVDRERSLSEVLRRELAESKLELAGEAGRSAELSRETTAVSRRMNDKLADLERQLQEANRKVRDLLEDRSRSLSEGGSLREELSSAQRLLGAARQRAAEQEAERECIAAALERARAELRSSPAMRRGESPAGDPADRVAAVEMEVPPQDAAAGLRSELAEAAGQLERRKGEQRRLEQDLVHEAAKAARRSEEARECRAECERAEGAVRDLRAELQAAAEQRAAGSPERREELRALQRELVRETAAAARHAAALEAAQGELAELRAEAERLRGELLSEHGALSAARAAAEAAEGREAAAAGRAAAAEARVAGLQEELRRGAERAAQESAAELERAAASLEAERVAAAQARTLLRAREQELGAARAAAEAERRGGAERAGEGETREAALRRKAGPPPPRRPCRRQRPHGCAPPWRRSAAPPQRRGPSAMRRSSCGWALSGVPKRFWRSSALCGAAPQSSPSRGGSCAPSWSAPRGRPPTPGGNSAPANAER